MKPAPVAQTEDWMDPTAYIEPNPHRLTPYDAGSLLGLSERDFFDKQDKTPWER